MASVFSYDPNPPRISSPWSTPGRGTPQPTSHNDGVSEYSRQQLLRDPFGSPIDLKETGLTKLEAEPQDGPTEYKLHLLLRLRRPLASISTLDRSDGSNVSAAFLLKAGIRQVSPAGLESLPASTTQSCQVRLEQLTTQLLWRLQQSSPFHSGAPLAPISSFSDQPARSGTPRNVNRLLPGLEESQGALYEIGVSDDGTFVGLTKDEMDESLVNLKLMASTLGCDVQVLREVIVGSCEWSSSNTVLREEKSAKMVSEALWVTEVLVRPNLDKCYQPMSIASPANLQTEVLPGNSGLDKVRSSTDLSESTAQQLRVALIGASGSGKSSLLGILTTSILDNGRGKSRLNLLKHPHEVASGVTSSVAQELIGYRGPSPGKGVEGPARGLPAVINYASENVSSWNEIHGSSSRLIFLSDSPGMARYAKSCLRTLVSWSPHWTILCIAANGSAETNTKRALPSSMPAAMSDQSVSETGPEDLLLHLQLCLKLGLPLVVVVTKMDIATKGGLRQIMSKVLSALKSGGRRPVMIPASHLPTKSSTKAAFSPYISTIDEAQVTSALKSMESLSINVVPIVLASSVTGQGVGQIHALLRSLPILSGDSNAAANTTAGTQEAVLAKQRLFQVDEVFAMPPSKVYNEAREASEAGHGAVFCGYLKSGTIEIGEIMQLGPFSEDNDLIKAESDGMQTSSSLPNPSLREQRSRLSGPKATGIETGSANDMAWQTVRIVSLRNLRLPSHSLSVGQVGTIGVEPIGKGAIPCKDLRRARKGMVLTSIDDSIVSYWGFTALFNAADFNAQTSPPLILGGHATAYINAVRAAVRVTSVSLDDPDSELDLPASQEGDVFVFDGDQSSEKRHQFIKITFRFQNSMEWMRADDQVFVVPNAVAAGPITGGPFQTTGALSGFVGKVCNLEVRQSRDTTLQSGRR